jgi:hypothetical protein
VGNLSNSLILKKSLILLRAWATYQNLSGLSLCGGIFSRAQYVVEQGRGRGQLIKI